MGINNTGFAACVHCGAEFRLFTIFNRDMQGLCKVWKHRHERACRSKTPAQRRKWAQKYAGKDLLESALTVDLSHVGFQETDGSAAGQSDLASTLKIAVAEQGAE